MDEATIAEKLALVTDIDSPRYNKSFPPDHEGQPKVTKIQLQLLKKMRFALSIGEYEIADRIKDRLYCICGGLGYIKSKFTGEYRECGFCLMTERI